METYISCVAVPMEMIGKHVASAQNSVSSAESHPIHYSGNFASDDSRFFASRALDLAGLSKFKISIWRFRYSTSARSITVPEGVSFAWRILHVLHPHHIQRVKALTYPDRRDRVVFQKEIYIGESLYKFI
jgi:hypothetical protein